MQTKKLAELLGLPPETSEEDLVSAVHALKHKATRARRSRGKISADRYGRISIAGYGFAVFKDDFDAVLSKLEEASAFARAHDSELPTRAEAAAKAKAIRDEKAAAKVTTPEPQGKGKGRKAA